MSAEMTEETLLDPAITDVAVLEEQETESTSRELTFDQKIDALGTAVTRHPLNKECLYKTLVFCSEEKPLREIEEEIATYPEFQSATQNQYHMVTTLVRFYGLELIERDDEGNQILPEQKEGLTEDEIDDLVATLNYRTTEVGNEFVRLFAPHSRLIDLLDLAPERSETYAELLDFVRAQPRSYDEIKELLAGKPALETIIAGRRETMQPSVFVDKLERAGALVWNKGWKLTEEGEGFLEELQSGKQTR